jgi:hypothetical protein
MGVISVGMLRFVASRPLRALADEMTSISDPSYSQEPVGGGSESVPDPEQEQLGGDDTVEANDELSNEEVER